MRDYHKWNYTGKELLKETGIFAALAAACAWLFYNRAAACAVLAVLLVPWLRLRGKQKAEERRKQMVKDFRDALNSMAVSLRAGRAVEYAFADAAADLAAIKGKGSDGCLAEEFGYMVRQIRMSAAPEQLLSDLAGRSGSEEIEDFAAVFGAARRSGGNMAAIIRNAAENIEGRIDVETEIEASLASKKLEQRIMSAMPAAMIFYMRVSSPGFLDVLYGNPAGVLMMTVLLAAYAASVLWGMHIVNIEV